MATTCFLAGGFNVNMPQFDAARAVDLIEEKKITFMMVFSPVLATLLEEQKKTGKNIRSLEPLPASTRLRPSRNTRR